MERAIWAQGLRRKIEPGKKRHPYQANHSAQVVQNSCEIAGMKPINIEKLMNHSIGISDSYYRATEQELLEDSLKAVDMLSINDDKVTLQKQVAELTEKSKEDNYIIKAKLSEKDGEIAGLKQKYDADIALLKEAMLDMQQLLKNPEKLAEVSRAANPEISL
jgi:hypothetical protein